MTIWIAIILAGLGTYASRAVFIVALADRRMPPRLEQGLEFVGPAVLAALVVTLMVDSSGTFTGGVAELSALAVGAAVAWKVRNLLAVVAAGMATFWLVGFWL